MESDEILCIQLWKSHAFNCFSVGGNFPKPQNGMEGSCITWFLLYPTWLSSLTAWSYQPLFSSPACFGDISFSSSSMPHPSLIYPVAIGYLPCPSVGLFAHWPLSLYQPQLTRPFLCYPYPSTYVKHLCQLREADAFFCRHLFGQHGLKGPLRQQHCHTVSPPSFPSLAVAALVSWSQVSRILDQRVPKKGPQRGCPRPHWNQC